MYLLFKEYLLQNGGDVFYWKKKNITLCCEINPSQTIKINITPKTDISDPDEEICFQRLNFNEKIERRFITHYHDFSSVSLLSVIWGRYQLRWNWKLHCVWVNMWLCMPDVYICEWLCAGEEIQRNLTTFNEYCMS